MIYIILLRGYIYIIVLRGNVMNENLIDLKELGKRIKELRLSLHQTQEQFSSLIYISTSYLALLETGKRTASIDVLVQIARVCHVSMDYLLFGTQEPPQKQNERMFRDLCHKYDPLQISSALSLAEFYLDKLI